MKLINSWKHKNYPNSNYEETENLNRPIISKSISLAIKSILSKKAQAGFSGCNINYMGGGCKEDHGP
jgi:hypothetical protein